MSLIQKSNPLNLQYQVCIVTAASTPLGMVICKTLLKANALVLGVDTRPKDDSLNAAQGTHFQFEQCDISQEGVAEKVIQAAYARLGNLGGSEKVDVLVNVVEKGSEGEMNGAGRLTGKVVEGMAGRGEGRVVNVPAEDAEMGRVIEFTKKLAAEGNKGVRCNVIAPSKDAANGKDQISAKAFEEAKGNMDQIINPQFVIDSNQTEEKKKLYNTGNLTLFLAGGMGGDVAGSIVYRDGSSSPL